MNPQKAMATVSRAPETMAIKDNSRLRIYNQPDSLSSKIDQILVGLIIGLNYEHLTVPERNMLLHYIEGLLRLRVSLSGDYPGVAGLALLPLVFLPPPQKPSQPSQLIQTESHKQVLHP